MSGGSSAWGERLAPPLLQEQLEAEFFVALAEDAIEGSLGHILDRIAERRTEECADEDADQAPDGRADEEG